MPRRDEKRFSLGRYVPFLIACLAAILAASYWPSYPWLWIVVAVAIGWPQLDAVYEHGLAWARSQAFYDQTLFWQWMRMPGDIVFSAGALLMAWDFLVKLRRPRGEMQEPAVRAATVR